jgi:signal peptidase I
MQEAAQSTPTPQFAGTPGPTSRPRWYGHMWNWARDLFISIGISAFIIIFLYQPVEVEGTSMLPGLQDQERIFVNKFVYKFEAIQRGDIVVFHYPLDPTKSYIKRVIGVPGDHIRVVEGQVYVNDIPLAEPYVPSEYFDTRSMFEITVGENSYFVLGDHRSMSNDSRDFGAVDQKYIFGKAVLVYWPVDKLSMVR